MPSRARLLIIIFVVVLVAIVGGSLLLASLSKTGTNKSPNALPIGSDHPSVSSVVATYSFSGEVGSLDNDSIVLKSKGAPLPEFQITARTPVSKKGSGDKPTRSSQDELKRMQNANVNLTVLYDFKTGSWVATHIMINNSN